MLQGLLCPEGARKRMSIYFRIARLPRAQPLPLILAELGTFRWQLSNQH